MEENNVIVENKKKRSPVPFIIGGVLLVAAYFGFQKVNYLLHNEDTENSQLEANIVPVLPRIGGWVTNVKVKDNQIVKAGDTLLTIDDRDYKLKVQQAEDAVKNAESNVALISANAGTAGANEKTSDASFQAQNAGIESSNAAIATANANVEAAKIRVWKATQDYNRYKTLVEEKSAPAQMFDNAKAEKESAESALVAAQSQVETAQKSLEVVRRQANVGSFQKSAAQTQMSAAQRQIDVAKTQVEQRRAELEFAKLQATYTAVTAPVAGEISRKSVQLGQLVNAGQPLMSLVQKDEVWVVANFKETQVAKMSVGQKVKVIVDAYKNKELEGTIESFAGATGAKFSLLPPDNSTGNFVKVVQRVPTKIIITDPKDPNFVLRPGMSVSVVVPVK